MQLKYALYDTVKLVNDSLSPTVIGQISGSYGYLIEIWIRTHNLGQQSGSNQIKQYKKVRSITFYLLGGLVNILAPSATIQV